MTIKNRLHKLEGKPKKTAKVIGVLDLTKNPANDLVTMGYGKEPITHADFERLYPAGIGILLIVQNQPERNAESDGPE